MCLFSGPQRQRSGVLTPLTWLGLLPRIVHERRRLRSLAARALTRWQGLSGYVALHRVPPEAFAWLDIPEREDMFAAADIGGVPTFLATARQAGLDVYAAPWQIPEEQRFGHAHDALAARQPRLAFLYAGALDGALHRDGNRRATTVEVGGAIAKAVAKARRLLSAGLPGGVADVLTLVVGDHGMADVVKVVDPRPAADELAGTRLFVDSTMMRFWGDSTQLDRCRLAMERSRAPGRWLDSAALRAREVPVADAPYGDAIFVLDEGVLFAPSFLGGQVRGMHGYDTACASANAALASDHDIPGDVTSTASLAGYILRSLGLDHYAPDRTVGVNAGDHSGSEERR